MSYFFPAMNLVDFDHQP